MAKRESQDARKARTAEIYSILRKTYPRARCTLDFTNPLELLVATILAAQCTDARVNIITKSLFRKYPTVEAYARAGQEELEGDIRSAGFYRNKAKAIRLAAGMILDRFGGKVPGTMAELLMLPGVARKTANVILGNSFGQNEGITVDTHVGRVSQRLGLSRHEDPVKIEQDLMELVPRDQWMMFSHVLVFHGRECCTARSPNCAGCPVNKLCPSAFTFDKPKGR